MQNSNSSLRGRLDIGRCFNDAIDVYKKNFPVVLLATLLLGIISLSTLLILAGVLGGGFSWMMLNAMRREDRKIDLGDMFRTFNKFFPLTGLFLLQSALVFMGFVLFLVPGILLGTMWLFSIFLMVDKNKNVISSLKVSWNIVRRKGLGVNLILCVIYLVFAGGLTVIPYIGNIVSFFLVPLAYLLLTSAYIQQVHEDEGELTDVLLDKVA
ncbi:hypothetical protein ACFL0P_01200 [Candidatus Omnitrophota bacterium]